MTINQVVLRRAIESVRHIPDENAPWRDILRDTSQLFGADGAYFILNRNNDFTFHKVNTDDAVERDYTQHYHKDDVLFHYGISQPTFTLLDTQQLVSAKERQRSSYFTDFLFKHRMRQLFCIGLINESPSNWNILGFQRETPDDRLSDHFQTAEVRSLMAELRAAIALRTQQTKLWTQASDSLFEPLGEVALLATPRGYITHCAPHARERLSGEGGIVREEQLWHRSTGIRQRLHHALAQAAAGMRCVPVHIPALGGAAPSMRVDFTRADPRLGMMNETLVFVRVRFADMPADVSVELLRQAFPITQAEAQVLASLIRGETTKDIVVRTGASIHTVRKQISMLMTKMECTRQLELVSKARALF